ncbi:MAG: type II toxin-antitoxin system ParD family antitoxin [Thermoprotei archaeon]|nr:type II toxin-antitoxin system ParD family antitoxin [Thermoprotei archaeon]
MLSEAYIFQLTYFSRNRLRDVKQHVIPRNDLTNTNLYVFSRGINSLGCDKVQRKSHLRLVSIHLPESYVEGLDELVLKGLYPSRSEAIRIAVRDLLKRELWRRRRYRSVRMIG